LHGSLDSLPVSLAIGTNQALETARAYIDTDGFRQEGEQPRKHKRSCTNVFLHSPLKGVLKKEPRWELFEGLPSYCGIVKKYYVGKEVNPTVDLLTAPGIVFLTSSSEEQLIRDYAHIRKLEEEGFYEGLVA
jgi:hypothetical protein